ncbi:uncharacterized protein MYCFIDRAFT_134426 [Pseudocercospora fijiensis CIRAD86]|uniref:Uncharacterized protein n=1 Tax=Pseudocercospora fijiensis (strain CIRAD86) TaxID=383855 RepID=M2Z2E4_PSEFD|nr:uncharacterized protein MYCFIDRAFT_134426 [Pseudocercospora fijiensis CIRAD86]EME84010.1 hypothetical protein MYCFIDRAFT_134426 [Pseudocercospora fijiensis CIRAD86]
MCSYTFLYYYCGCGWYIINDTIEFCANRSLSGYSVDVWGEDMCSRKAVTCEGLSRFYCSECSEDHTLEYELEE